MDGLTTVVLRNVRTLLADAAGRHSDLAGLMRIRGYPWHANHLGQLFAGRGDLTIGEVASLASCFRVDLARLLAGDEDEIWEAPDGTAHSLVLDREGLTGGVWPEVPAADPAAPADEVETARLARRLGRPPELVDWAARVLYGVSLIERREQLLGETDGVARRSLQARRGHVTRQLLGEITDWLAENDTPAQRRPQRRRS